MTVRALKEILANISDNTEVVTINIDHTLADRRTTADVYHAKGLCNDEFIDVLVIGYE